jgi:uncharacterized protein YegP (UPF0339 family)
MERFDIWQSPKDGLWYFHLVSPNNEIIAQSQGYTTKENCISGINAIKNYSQTAEIKETTKE